MARIGQDSYLVPTKAEPTYWNKDAALGFLLGFGIPGALIGGYIGHNRMEEEAVRGKVVSKPSFWNKDTVIGWIVGSYLGAAAGIALGLTAMALSGGSAGVGIAVGLASGLGTLATSTMVGGNSGYARLEKEYNAAAEYTRQQEQSKGLGRNQVMMEGVTPEMAQLLESRLAQGSAKSMAERVQFAPQQLQLQ